MSDTTQAANFDSTINLLKQDLSSVDVALAVSLIEEWENQLQGTEIFEDLMELKQAILDGNLTELETLLRDLGEDTSAIASSLREEGSAEVAAKVEQVSKLLSQASRNVK
ncbi:MAG: hypothetical protein Kow00121_02790 [Elainellaceae cyanobacterium]